MRAEHGVRCWQVVVCGWVGVSALLLASLHTLAEVVAGCVSTWLCVAGRRPLQ